MPRPKKPDALKLISSSRQPLTGKVIDLPTVSEVPSAPSWLPNECARAEFAKLAKILHINGLLTEAAVSALGHLAALHGTIVELWESGEVPTGHLMAQYRNLVNDFGITPAAQGKVTSTADKKPANKFASNGKRAQQ